MNEALIVVREALPKSQPFMKPTLENLLVGQRVDVLYKFAAQEIGSEAEQGGFEVVPQGRSHGGIE